jgi:arylsulfatase A-like enzyme
MTRRAIQFMREAKADGRPWCLHLSYIKPHWPYIVSAPYHDMYGPDDVVPAKRVLQERESAHPLLAAFQEERYSKVFEDEARRRHVIPAYMGLIKQIDDQLGLLFAFMAEEGLDDVTMVVFTSDHGDYLGDHWLGEKYLFHDMSVRVPLIIADPSPAAAAARGTTCDALVEMIDLAPTFIEWFGGRPKSHWLEGRSLLPWLHGRSPPWRQVAISEYDYAFDLARVKLKVPVSAARLYMVTDGRWKYVHADGFPPMLYDLATDPDEYVDLGQSQAHAAERARLYEHLARWSRMTRTQTTVSDEEITASDEAVMAYDVLVNPGILIGYWDEVELAEELRKRDAFKAARKSP